MKLHELSADDDAVSPVIGVILMVAITVILAAVIGTFVLGLGGQIEETPNAQFDFNERSNESLTITHNGGDPVSMNNVNVSGGGDLDGTGNGSYCQHHNVGNKTWSGSDSELGPGDACTLPADKLESDEEVRVTWESDSGESTSVLAGPYPY